MEPLQIVNKHSWVLLALSIGIAIFGVWYNQYIHDANPQYHPTQLSKEEIATLSNDDPNAIVIYPIFTQYAYEKHGFYDFYTGKCDSCRIAPFDYRMNSTYNTGQVGFNTLQKLHYHYVTDITVDQHPDILQNYDKIILLHNEYVTKKEFNAILNHKNVMYFYPNALYAEISVDYDKKQMTLVRGHGYPEKSIMNGFNYVTSSQWEYDTDCDNYSWKERPNGMGLTCFPEYLLTYDRKIMQVIKDYPAKTPYLIPLNFTAKDLSQIKYCDWNGCQRYLDDVLNKSKS